MYCPLRKVRRYVMPSVMRLSRPWLYDVVIKTVKFVFIMLFLVLSCLWMLIVEIDVVEHKS
jgi:hypothetical protein